MNQIIVGVDTHKSNHIAVAIDAHGARLGSMTIPTTRKGYNDLQTWGSQFGHVKAFGIEGAGSYGAGLSRDLQARGIRFWTSCGQSPAALSSWQI
ncbi:IS110 family transposase [Pseudaestuariivita rosea]|uniref:IS110 family transposase n=1 Tax=Pseudaestuariivita rosea TaxID=2763263 RepID=UPI001F1AB2BD|nr:IS110 family transposase [Pseudaestuariivita rosea]